VAAGAGDGGILERARFALTLAVALAACHGDHARSGTLPVPGDAGPYIAVEVRNASGKPGLARVGTRVLREAGIDVVDFGNAPAPSGKPPLDTTQILVRRGGASTGERIRRALHAGKIILAPDTTLLLDASVLLGLDFSPRLELHP
jgi:hypothetical protein